MNRYYFLQDGSGHWYQIPIGRNKDFARLLWDEDDSGLECWEREEWDEFEGYRLLEGISQISFENPIEDE